MSQRQKSVGASDRNPSQRGSFLRKNILGVYLYVRVCAHTRESVCVYVYMSVRIFGPNNETRSPYDYTFIKFQTMASLFSINVENNCQLSLIYLVLVYKPIALNLTVESFLSPLTRQVRKTTATITTTNVLFEDGSSRQITRGSLNIQPLYREGKLQNAAQELKHN